MINKNGELCRGETYYVGYIYFNTYREFCRWCVKNFNLPWKYCYYGVKINADSREMYLSSEWDHPSIVTLYLNQDDTTKKTFIVVN